MPRQGQTGAATDRERERESERENGACWQRARRCAPRFLRCIYCMCRVSAARWGAKLKGPFTPCRTGQRVASPRLASPRLDSPRLVSRFRWWRKWRRRRDNDCQRCNSSSSNSASVRRQYSSGNGLRLSLPVQVPTPACAKGETRVLVLLVVPRPPTCRGSLLVRRVSRGRVSSGLRSEERILVSLACVSYVSRNCSRWHWEARLLNSVIKSSPFETFFLFFSPLSRRRIQF